MKFLNFSDLVDEATLAEMLNVPLIALQRWRDQKVGPQWEDFGPKHGVRYLPDSVSEFYGKWIQSARVRREFVRSGNVATERAASAPTLGAAATPSPATCAAGASDDLIGEIARAVPSEPLRAVRFAVPWPPSVNTYWRHVGNRVHVSAAGRRYKGIVASRVALVFGETFEGDVGVVMVCRPPDRRKRDIDNVLKALFDSLTMSGLWRDDSQVKLLTVRMAPAPLKGEAAEGGVDVQVFPL